MAVGLFYHSIGQTVDLLETELESWPRAAFRIRADIRRLENLIEQCDLEQKIIDQLFFHQTTANFSSILRYLQARRHIREWQVICDRRNNTPAMADQGLWGINIMIAASVSGVVELAFPHERVASEKSEIWKPY